MDRQDLARAALARPHRGLQACTAPPGRTWKAWVTHRPKGDNRVLVSVSGKDHPSSGKGTDGREAMLVLGGQAGTDDTVI